MSRVPKPPELTNETVLPFSVWRILDLIDGQRSIDQIALLLGISSEQANKQIDAIFQLLERLEKQSQVLDEATIERVAKTLMKVLGPWGQFAVEDALNALGDSPTLAQLLNQLINKDMTEKDRPEVLAELRNEGLI